jgi:hypothetical protein
MRAALALADGAPIITLSAGTTHKPPPLDVADFPVVESVAGAQWLMAYGYPRALLWAETTSLDTIGNAYFARVQHTDPAGLRHLLVVTSAFHMPRTRLIFERVFALPPVTTPYSLRFHATENIGLTADAVAARAAKEASGADQFRRTIAGLQDLRALHHWLFTEHQAYATGGTPRAAPPDSAALASY